MVESNVQSYTVLATQKESEQVTTITFEKPEHFRFVAGQFVTVFFPHLGVSEGKAYSLSSIPEDNYFSLTVKDIGPFSHALCSLSIGDMVTISLPYGYFYTEEIDTNIILLASGIGISPFRSLVVSLLKQNPERKITLYYSEPYYSSAIFLALFEDLRSTYAQFRYVVHITQETISGEHVRFGRISPHEVVKIHREGKNEYFVCGSTSFVKDMWKGLKETGVPEESIYTEAFFR